MHDESPDASFDWTSFGHQALAGMVVAAGKVLLDTVADAGIEATISAAAKFASHPDDETAAIYSAAATDSYPIGAMGDGCYSIDMNEGCGPGTGCRSGAGTLREMSYTLGPERVWDALKRDMVPWLRCVRDPLLSSA